MNQSYCCLIHYVMLLHPLGYIHITLIIRSTHQVFRKFSCAVECSTNNESSVLFVLPCPLTHRWGGTVAHPEWHCGPPRVALQPYMDTHSKGSNFNCLSIKAQAWTVSTVAPREIELWETKGSIRMKGSYVMREKIKWREEEEPAQRE